jgi:hypothetical protein
MMAAPRTMDHCCYSLIHSERQEDRVGTNWDYRSTEEGTTKEVVEDLNGIVAAGAVVDCDAVGDAMEAGVELGTTVAEART